MKFIKKYEELKMATYTDAANKLRDHGQIKRSNRMLKHAIGEFDINLELYKYSSRSTTTKHSKDCKVSFYEYKISYGDDQLDTIEELAKANLKYFYVSFYFVLEINNKEVVISPFDISFNLNSDESDEISIEFVPPADITSIIIDKEEYGVNGGIFTNRQSAGRFKNKILLNLLDDPKFQLSDLISLSGGEASQLVEFENAIKNINPNLMCGDDSITKFETSIKLY